MKTQYGIALTLCFAASLSACAGRQKTTSAPRPVAAAPAPAPKTLEPAAVQPTQPERAPAVATAAAPTEKPPVVAEPAAAPPAPPAPAVAPAVEPDAGQKKMATASAAGAVGGTIPAYKNTVQRPGAAGKAEPFDTTAVTKPTLYIVNSTTCPYSKAYADRMKEIETAYMGKGVDVIHVYPVREQTAEEKAKYHAEKGFAGGLVDDADAEFARKLEIHKTPTVILADAKGVIVYRGRIDDNQEPAKVHVHELAAALDEHLAGKPVTVTTTEPFG